jgi:diacylglycerol kinase family enzyme
MAEVCVIFNPTAGRGRAQARLNKLRRVLGTRAEFWPTSRAGQASELATQAAAAGFPIVAAAGGDGTVHEVANGLLLARKPDTILAVLPIGSANDYAYSLQLDADWWLRKDPTIGVRRVDVGVVRSPGGRERFFVNGLGLGFNGAVTREARRIRGLQGMTLYGLAIFRAMRLRYDFVPLRLQVDGGAEQRVPTLALTLGLGRREGNFLLTPDALLDDGLFDYLHVGRLSRLGLICYVPRMILGRIPRHDPVIGSGRCRRVEVRSETPLMVHIDGEFFCVPEEGVRELEVDLLPGRLPVFGRLPAPTGLAPGRFGWSKEAVSG